MTTFPGIALTDPHQSHHPVVYANPAFGELMGYGSEELFGRPCRDLLGDDHPVRGLPDRITATLRTEKEFRVVLPSQGEDGQNGWKDLSISPIRGLDGRLRFFLWLVTSSAERSSEHDVINLDRDITTLLSEVSTISEATSRVLETLCQRLHWQVGIMWHVDQAANVLRCAGAWSFPTTAVAPDKTPNEQTDMKEFIELTRLTTFPPGVELPGRVWAAGRSEWIGGVEKEKNGPRASAALAAGLHGVFACPVIVDRQTIGVLEFFGFQVQPLHPALQASLQAIGSQFGQFVRRRHVEAAQLSLEAQLRQAQKMEAIGNLAGGIAHDFNNILAAINGFTELALYQATGQKNLERNLQEVLAAGLRAKELVRQILLFSRQDQPEVKPVKLDVIVKEALSLLRATLPATIEIRQRIDVEQATVLADPTQMHQVLLNLCANAEYAMRETGGILEVHVQEAEVGKKHLEGHGGLEPGPYIVVRVRDTGCGMSSDIRSRIFDPFFTTKASGEGTGLGLAVVHGIITSLGGNITVSSEPGRGSTFEIWLPKLRRNQVVEQETHEPLPRGHERILLVDDEQPVAKLCQEMLRCLGYTTEIQTRAREALDVFQKRPDDFDLVITDQTLPLMTGESLARELLHLRPDLPIIICTGFSHTMNAEKARSLGIRAFLMKPIGLQSLARTVRRVLDQTANAQDFIVVA